MFLWLEVTMNEVSSSWYSVIGVVNQNMHLKMYFLPKILPKYSQFVTNADTRNGKYCGRHLSNPSLIFYHNSLNQSRTLTLKMTTIADDICPDRLFYFLCGFFHHQPNRATSSSYLLFRIFSLIFIQLEDFKFQIAMKAKRNQIIQLQ